MNLGISLFIALRYWRAKSADRFGRLVTNLASAGIMLGVMALIIVLSVMNGLEQYQKKQVLSDIPHAIVMPKDDVRIPRQENQNKIRQVYLSANPGILQDVALINTTNAIYQTVNGVSAGQVIGVQNPTDDKLLTYLDKTQFDSLLPEGEFKLIIGSQLAEKLHVKIGDKVRLMLTENSQYTPFGRVPAQRLFTVSDVYFSGNEVSGYESFANIADIGRLMRIKPQEVQGMRLFLKDPFQITELPRIFPEEQWNISDWRSQKGEFFQAVRMEKNMMGLLISLIIIVAVSNIVTSLSLMVVDKQGEIAILQTQGLTKRQVRRIFILQGLLVGTVGTMIGAVLGVIITFNLDTILNFINPTGVFLPTQISVTQVAVIVVFSLGSALLSTIYPAYRASKVEPAEALRYE
ncbi:lipoprotein-releasing system transmembrane subunit LolC [Actinobacillus succinogenes]|uniref:Lipoprotein releasing system, transmembrane protein, LolC/E family n=1 Tax=Actinobacillus succinogenes (strain ATCC 55618 / DSM 22257 / CCUG 43843 / 130Z) TaxID=339671 RepID=A6VP93_ACTSZ|nr:lipoprotein-releasing ABC transporter permease subunit [Actinobacillus succinogenes]ABR74790.1 lipoprotein releasing system, transmembrane protein, LolC/E family [Actinobacillus succinogenes 130Z]PHI40792.1 lipoprotein-releasing system transmembrane subunit LolC [Actinobacillus succinogenes]